MKNKYGWKFKEEFCKRSTEIASSGASNTGELSIRWARLYVHGKPTRWVLVKIYTRSKKQ